MGSVVIVNAADITRRVLELVPGASEPEMRFDRSGLAGWFLATVDGRRRTVSWWRQVSAWAPILDDEMIAAYIAKELQS